MTVKFIASALDRLNKAEAYSSAKTKSKMPKSKLVNLASDPLIDFDVSVRYHDKKHKET